VQRLRAAFHTRRAEWDITITPPYATLGDHNVKGNAMKDEGNTVVAPGGICGKCFDDPTKTHPLCPDSPVLVAYCNHNNTGGFIQRDFLEMRWTMFSPVGQAEWHLFIRDAICDVIEADHMHLMDKEDHYCKCNMVPMDPWRLSDRT